MGREDDPGPTSANPLWRPPGKFQRDATAQGSWATSSASALAGLAPLKVGVGEPGGRGVDDVVQQVHGRIVDENPTRVRGDREGFVANDLPRKSC